jgi:hypothetical protein
MKIFLTIDIPARFIRLCGSLENKLPIYAEHEVSRTPHAQQRPQKPPEQQRQI